MSNLKRSAWLFILAIFMAAGSAFAQEAPKAETPKQEEKKELAFPVIDLSGVMYLWYQNDFTNEKLADKNKDHFAINRVYLTWAKKFDDVWSMRVTTDVDGTEGSGKANNKVYFKFAYAEMKQSFDPVVFKVQLGIVSAPITNIIDKVAEQRWLNENTDKAKEVLYDSHASKTASGKAIDNTADLGIKIDIEVIKMITLTGMYSAGEGYGKGFNELTTDSSKAYYGMLTVNPIKPVYFAAYYKRLDNNYAPDGTQDSHNYLRYWGFLLAWSDKNIKVGATYSIPAMRNGSVMAKYTLLDAWANLNLNAFIGFPVLVYGRFAMGSSKFNTGNETTSGTIKAMTYEAGLGYQFNNNVRTMALYEMQNNENYNGVNRSLWIRTEVKF